MIIDTGALEETESRYRDRRPERTEQCRQLTSGNKLQADAPERLQERLRRLGCQPSPNSLLAEFSFT